MNNIQNTKITDNIAFIIEEENNAWGYYHTYYLLTEKGDVYTYDATYNNNVFLANKTKIEIDKLIKTMNVSFLKKIDITEVNMMILKSEEISKDSKSHCRRVAFDAGHIKYYAFNAKDSELPILIGERGDVAVDSENEIEESITRWLQTNIAGFQFLNI